MSLACLFGCHLEEMKSMALLDLRGNKGLASVKVRQRLSSVTFRPILVGRMPPPFPQRASSSLPTLPHSYPSLRFRGIVWYSVGDISTITEGYSIPRAGSAVN